MKLTEKELNEFPIGTKIHCGKDTIIKAIKADFDACNWRKMEEHGWISANTLKSYKIDKIEIPTYTEYIPPKPILDDKEKEYLSYVIRPWRKKVKGIMKADGTGYEWIRIYLRGESFITLPLFGKGTMYKGMVLDKEYSLEDLGL